MDQTAWCRTLRAWVRILEKRDLFGATVATVWVEGSTQVCTVPVETLCDNRPADLDDALSLVAGARIWNALGSDVFFAPLVSHVIPLPHQFRVLRRAMSSFPVRMLLADEVGLGKTIEAGLIFKELKLRGMIERVLVLVPKSLQFQWVAEMEEHFGEEFELAEPGMWGLSTSLRSDNPWKRYRQVVVSLDSVKPRSSQKGWTSERIARFNLERFHDIVNAGWDLVIIDESHKVAGSSDDVARFALAKQIAKTAPHLLLLSATPHSGKRDAFRRLLSLIDPTSFGVATQLTREVVQPYVIRTEKRTAIDADGKALFVPRTTTLLQVPFASRHSLQQSLYDEVSHYITTTYNRLDRSGNRGLRLLLILIQRLMSSSTRAVRRFLDERLNALTQGEANVAPLPDSISDDEDDMDELQRLAAFAKPTSNREIGEVRRLLELAIQVEQTGPDARAEALHEQMLGLIQKDGEPAKKFLVFTEFVATQQMLADFLEQRGFAVTTLNGSMGLEERKSAQDAFSKQAQILISTDAGGEGLNLQFAHIVFNYDLPWNPMRVEQRIGRVDRIGQLRPVIAINLVIENSIEARIYEVLQQKLAVILDEFGVDKTGDVLDSREAGAQFEDLARTALFKPEVFDKEFERILTEIRTAARESVSVKALFADDSDLKSDQQPIPLSRWLSVLRANDQSHSSNRDCESLDFSEAVLDQINTLKPYFVPGKPIPSLNLLGLGFKVDGWFSIWRVGIAEGLWRQQHVFSLFVSRDGEAFGQSAQRIWDALASRDVDIHQAHEEPLYDFASLEAIAQGEAKSMYDRVIAASRERVRRRKVASDLSYLARRAAIQEISINGIRQTREQELEVEYTDESRELEQAKDSLPDLRCLFLAKVGVH